MLCREYIIQVNADSGSEKDIDPGDEWLLLIVLSGLTDGTHEITLTHTHEFTFYIICEITRWNTREFTLSITLWNTIEFTFYKTLSPVLEITSKNTHEFTPPLYRYRYNPKTISFLS